MNNNEITLCEAIDRMTEFEIYWLTDKRMSEEVVAAWKSSMIRFVSNSYSSTHSFKTWMRHLSGSEYFTNRMQEAIISAVERIIEEGTAKDRITTSIDQIIQNCACGNAC